MLVYLVRHGIAFDRADPKCPPDPERPLTEKGLRRTREAARGLRRLYTTQCAIFTSPYLRARQTAAVFAEVFDVPQREIVETNALLPGAPPDQFVKQLLDADDENIMAFGHAPNLDEIVAVLLHTPHTVTSLKKAGVAVLAWNGHVRDAACVDSLFTPKALRGLAQTR